MSGSLSSLYNEQSLERWQICTDFGSTVYYAAQDDSSAAVCLGVPRFATGAIAAACRGDANPIRSHVADSVTVITNNQFGGEGTQECGR